MDGLDLARHIRSEPGIAESPAGAPDFRRSTGRCVALALPGYLRLSDQTRAAVRTVRHLDESDGPVDRLSEPCRSRHQQAEAPRDPTAAHTGLRILLAEDHPVNQKVAVRMLERLGHAVVVAADGNKAIAALEDGRFDVVLMDVQMPEMDGFEAVRIIRARETTTGTHLPIIALTAHAMQGDRERCLRAGFDDYLAKPIRQRDLQAALSGTRRQNRRRTAGSDHALLEQLNTICGETTPSVASWPSRFWNQPRAV